MNIFNNIPLDDADHLLYLIEQAHRPFANPPISIGDIANEWVRRFQRSHPKSRPSIGQSLNPRIASLQEAYAPRQEPQPEQLDFSFEEAVKALESRWPGIRLGEPERLWQSQPHIRELHQLRSDIQKSDDTRYNHPVREMVR